jgi:hypothetical protein
MIELVANTTAASAWWGVLLAARAVGLVLFVIAVRQALTRRRD